MAKIKSNPRTVKLAQTILETYQPESVEGRQNALKDIVAPMFEAMLQGEMNTHLRYESNDHSLKETSNRRNGYSNKKVKTSTGSVDLQVPHDRDASFNPQLIKRCISHRRKSAIYVRTWYEPT